MNNDGQVENILNYHTTKTIFGKEQSMPDIFHIRL